MIARIATLCAVCAATGIAAAQTSPITFEAGYFHSNSFNGTHLSGLELGASQQMLGLPMVGSLRVGASIVFGRTFGGGADGNLYRLRALYRTTSVGPDGMYGLAGINFQSAQARAGSFGSETGMGLEFGIGVPLTRGLPGGLTVPGVGMGVPGGVPVPKMALEFGYRLGPKEMMRGFSANIAVRF